MDHDSAVAMLKAIAKAFDKHDLVGIMAHFADDAVFDGPRGNDPWGTRFEGARGGEHWTLRDGKVVKKDSFWKIRPAG